MAGAKIIYADCNKEDLCISLTDIKKRVTSKTKAVCVVHIGGHISFEIEKITLSVFDGENRQSDQTFLNFTIRSGYLQTTKK